MVEFKFPDVGEGIHEGKVLKWHYDVGDEVEEGETMVVVETDKVNAELPVPEDGVLKKKGAEVGDTVEVGDVLAVIDDGSGDSDETPQEDEEETDETEEASEEEEEGASVVGEVQSSDEVLPPSGEEESESTDEDRPALATPVARKMAKDMGVEIKKIAGSGPQGRVMKDDIRKAARAEETPEKEEERTATAPSMPSMREADTTRESIGTLRKTIVEAMDTSNQLIPATTVMDEFDVSDLVAFRNEQKSRAESEDKKLTYLPLIIKASILAMKKYPIFNASFDHEKEEIVYKHYFNIGLAVDTPDGLVVPNIKDADEKSLLELAGEVQDLAGRAREKKLDISELRDTTFSITNYGAFGAKLGTPVINHPEVAILGMGAIHEKPLVIDGEITARHVLPISLTVDHRVIDGGDAGRFMVELKRYLQDPYLLLLS